MAEFNAEGILALINANKQYLIGAGVGGAVVFLIMKNRGKRS